MFFGNVTDPATGAKLAEMVMASIPQAGGGDEVFVYYISSPDKNGSRTHGGMQLKPLNVDAVHFDLGWMPMGGKPSDLQKYFTGNYDPTKKTIEGDTTRGYINGKHTLKYVGEGKAAVFRTMGQIITDQSSDQPINVQQDLAKFNIRVALWP